MHRIFQKKPQTNHTPDFCIFLFWDKINMSSHQTFNQKIPGQSRIGVNKNLQHNETIDTTWATSIAYKTNLTQKIKKKETNEGETLEVRSIR